jgi:hypothetical protein
MKSSTILAVALCFVFVFGRAAGAAPIGTVFTYQGRLIDANDAADGLYDLQFELYSDPCLSLAVYKVGPTITINNLDVVDGYFTAELDFGTWGVFTGDARWLQIAVAPDGMIDPPVYTVLNPRQKITPTPYALYAASGPGVPVPLSLSASSANPVISGTNTGAGPGVYGEAADTGNITNYGGHFKAAGRYGRAVFGEGTGESGRGVLGETSGKYGIAVQGTASGDNSYAVYGFASGASGRGVYGNAFKTGDVENYGGYFQAAGNEGRAVYGKATATGTGWLMNYGGYFEAAGVTGIGVLGEATGGAGIGVRGRGLGQGIGVIGEAPDEEAGTNVGGIFTAAGVKGRGVVGEASGVNGIGVVANGKLYDFYASGDGIDYGAASSIRWKTDIRPIDDPVEKVMNLRGVCFNWDAEHGGGHDVGMIAEEVGRVLPEIVSYEENGIDAIGMDYSKLTPLLVEAVKTLKTEIDQIRKENAELRDRLATLETTAAKPVRF